MKQKINKPVAPVSSSWSTRALLGLYGIVGISLSTFGGFKVPFAESNAKEHWRHALAGIILVFVLIAGIVSFAIFIFNANYFKSQIVDYVKTNNQRDLTLDGDLKVTFFPKLGLDAGKMTLSQRNSNKNFASIESGHFHIAWWPLFLKQLQIESVELHGVHANLIRYKTGGTNLDDFFAAEGELANIKFEIDSIQLLNSSINLQDEAAGYFFSLHGLVLKTGKLAEDTAGDMSASFRLESAKPRVDTQVKISSHLLFDLKTRHYELANFEGEMEGEAAGISNLALSFQGSIHGNPAAEQLTMDKLVASAKGMLDSRKLDAKLDIANLKLEKKKMSGSTLTFNATLLQEDENLTASIEMPAFVINDNKLSSENISANIDLFKSGRTLQGKLLSPINMDFTSRKLDLTAVSGNLTATHPALAGKLAINLSGNLQADFGEQNAKLALKAKIDDSTIAGSLGMQNFSKPAYTFDLGVNTLDLDHYLATDWSKRLLDDSLPFDFSGLKDLNLHGKFHSNELKFAKLKMNNTFGEIKAEQSVLLLEPFNTRLYGGNTTGSLRINVTNKNQISFKQKLNNVQINAMLADFMPGDAKLVGKGNLTVDLNSSGENMGSLRKALYGNASLVLGRGSIAGINLVDTILDNKQQLGVAQAKHTANAKFSDATPFTELKFTMDIADGKAHSGDFLMKSPLYSSKGEGDISLDTGLMSYHLNTTVAPNLKRSSHGEITELRGITIPMQINGPYATPSITLDLGAASGGNLDKLIKLKAAKIATPVTVPSKVKIRTKPSK
jgi:AsmA protein